MAWTDNRQFELELEEELSKLESELYRESESEQFFGSLASLLRRPTRPSAIQRAIGSIPFRGGTRRLSGRRPVLKRIARGAGRQAIVRGRRVLRRSGVPSTATSSGGDPPPAPGEPGYDPSQDSSFGSVLGPQYNPYSSSYEPAGTVPEQPQSWQDAAGVPPEGETGQAGVLYPAAMMERFGLAAVETENEAEAGAMAGAMVPLAASMFPSAAPIILRCTPGLASGLSGVVRFLHRRPTTRPLIRTVPSILRRTAGSLARQASREAPLPPQAAVKTLAHQTIRMLESPKKLAQAFRRSQRLDRCLR